MSSYYYKGWYHRRYYRNHISERNRLTSQFAGIDKEIEKIFLNLSPVSLEKLLKEYGKKYGENAEDYARKTYSKWKSGSVRLSGQTAQRLLDLVPPYLTKERRYELIKKLRDKHIRRNARYISVTLNNWRHQIANEVNQLLEEQRKFDFPEELKLKATWLSSGDAETTKIIFNAIDEEEARIRASYLEAEFKRIESFISHLEEVDSEVISKLMKEPKTLGSSSI